MWILKRLKLKLQGMSTHPLGRAVRRFFRRSSVSGYDAIRFDPGQETVDEEQGTKDKAGVTKEANQRDEVSLAKARPGDAEVPIMESNKDPRQDTAGKAKDKAAVTQPWEKPFHGFLSTSEKDSMVPNKTETPVENILRQYRRLWVERQSNPTPLNYNPSRDLFNYIESANLISGSHGQKSAFESLLRFAMETPTAIDFLVQLCWGAMEHFPHHQAKEKFHQWLASLSISPQPRTPILGCASSIKKQPGAVKVTRQKRCTRIVTAAILSRCIALDILPRSSQTATSCFTYEFECLERVKATDEVDFIAACVFLRGCAGSWSSFRVGKLPDLLEVHKAVLEDWRYNLNISLLVENLAAKPCPYNETSAVLFENKQWVN